MTPVDHKRLNTTFLLLFCQPPLPESQADPSIEEKELKRKLEELASNISDKGASSGEEQGKKKEEPKPEMSSSSEDLPDGAMKVVSFLPPCLLSLPLRSESLLTRLSIWALQ